MASPNQLLHCLHYLAQVRLEHGGVVRAVLDLCRVLAERGHRVTLATWDATDVPHEWRSGGQGLPQVKLIDKPRITETFPIRRANKQAAALLAGVDVLHLHTPWDFANFAWAAEATARNIRYIVTIHGMMDDWSMAQKPMKKRLVHALVVKRFLNGARHVHTTAGAELEQAGKWFDRERGVVVPYVFDTAPYLHLPGPEEARKQFPGAASPLPKILFLSRLHPKKGVEALLEAAALLRADGPRCTYLIAGCGDKTYEQSLRDKAQSLGLSDCVHFLGEVRGTEKLSLYQASDLFVLPTWQENFGLVLPESLACGTPVVTTRGTDIHEELRTAGAIIIDRAPEAIAATITEAVRDLDGLKRLGQCGRQWVLDALSPDRVATQYENLYRQAIE